MIRIPTGPVPAKYARLGSFLLGVASLGAAHFAPQLSPILTLLGTILTPLGITLGNSAEPVKVPS